MQGMSTNHSLARVPRGVPTGGQFAASRRGESGTSSLTHSPANVTDADAPSPQSVRLARQAAQELIDRHGIEQADGEDSLTALGHGLGDGELTYESGMSSLVEQAVRLDRRQLEGGEPDSAQMRRQVQEHLDAVAGVDEPSADRTIARTDLMLGSFYDDDEDEPDQAVRDALTDLMHAAEARGIDFEEALGAASRMRDMERDEWNAATARSEVPEDDGRPQPTNTWTCDCGHPMARYRGQADTSCPQCGTWFNAGGQRLRSGWASNVSSRDEDVSDMDGYEAAHHDW